MKRIVFLGAGFTYMVLLIEAIRAAVAWWQGELAQPGWGDIALIALLPLLAWVWWRYISPFGRPDCGSLSRSESCLTPPDVGMRCEAEGARHGPPMQTTDNVAARPTSDGPSG